MKTHNLKALTMGEAYDETQCEYLKLDDGSLLAEVDSKREVVSAAFITPYPPGFPVLAPGQVISREIVEYLMALDVKEIHGYEPAFGLRVFTASAVNAEESRINGQPKLVPKKIREGAST